MTMNNISQKIYCDASGTIFSFLNKFLHEALLLQLISIRIIFF
jgi:hypothetical protein